jgi:hypothetical protein
MKYGIGFLLFLFAFLGCESGKLPSSPIDFFDGISVAETELVCTLDSFDIYNPNSFVCSGDRFYMQGDGLEVLLKLNTVEQKKELIAEKGNGPNELLNITNLSLAGKSLVLAECNKKKLVELDIAGQETEMKITDLPHEYGAFTSVIKNGNLLVATGLFEQGRYLCYDQTDKSVSSTGYYPSEKGNNRKTDNIRASNIFLSSKLVISPDLGHFACAHYNSGILDINKISNDSIINVRLLDFHYPETVERRRGNDIQVAIKRENINGFYDVAASDKYIFALYSGKSFKDVGVKIAQCDYLMVFDWNGNPVNCYKMDIPLTLVAFNEGDNLLYGIGINNNTELLKIIL